LIGIEDDRPRDVVLGDLVDRFSLDLRIRVLAQIRVLGNDDMTSTLLCEDFGCALEEQAVAAGRETDDDAHGLPVAGEGNHLDDLGRVTSFLPVLPTKILGKLEEGGLGLGSNKNNLFGLRVDVLEGGGVDRDRLVDQALELGGKDPIDVTLFDREVVCVFPIDLGLVDDLSHILFLRLFLFLIGGVRTGLVILEVANELGVDTDRTGDDAHDVLSERSSLVGADDGGVGHGLAGTEDANEQFFGGHPLRSECEGKGYGERETFRDGDDDQRDRDDQDVCKGNTLLASSTAGGELWEKRRR